MHVLRRDQDGDDLTNEPRLQHLPLVDRSDVYLFGANVGLRMQVVFGYDLLHASALGHSYGAYSVTEQPSCTEEGKETAKCSRCSATQTRTVSALGHEEVTDEGTPATCLQTGRSAGSHCSRCGITLEEQTIIPALGHDFRYSVVSEPTCVEEGSSLGTCSRCAETEENRIPALGHEEVTDEGTPATCLQTGRSAGSHCSRCGITLEEQTIIPALGHDFGEYRETRAPTCTEPGEEKAECSRCEAVETRTVAAMGHSTGPDATCTEDQVCTVCGAVLSPASGHHPGREATCTEDQVCTVCGAVLNAALGHALKEYEAQAPTCIEEGLGSIFGLYALRLYDLYGAPRRSDIRREAPRLV